MNPFHYLEFLDHHAYFIHSFKDSVDHLKNYLKDKFHIHHAQNPDFFYEKYETLGINESRRIKEIHSSKSFLEGNKRIFIIETSNITHEAQNSMLKIFEEPNEDSHFFLIMPSASLLLPTLRSRLSVIETRRGKEDSEIVGQAEKFIKLSLKDKIAFVDDLAKRISDEDEEEEKSTAIDFLGALEQVIAKGGVEKNTKALKAIVKARDYMNDRSPSVKQLLEFVALSL